MKNRIFNKHLSRKLFSLVLLTGILANAFSAGAQTRRVNSRTIGANQTKKAAPKCSGAWTGTITYVREQKLSDKKTTQRVSNRGTNRRESETNYDYTARVIVAESAARDGSNFGKGTVEYFFETIDKTISEEQNSCDRGKTWKTMRGEFSTQTEAYVSPAVRTDANVRVAVNMDGSYSVGGSLPPTTGKTRGRQTSVYSNQCVPKEGKNIQSPETAISVEGQSFTTDGSHRVDPKNPNHLSGSYTLRLTDTLVETISWNLEKCGAPLRITDLKFYHLAYPSPSTWEKVDDGYTIDGNEVKVVATVANFSGEDKRGVVNFRELNENMDLPGGKIDAALAPGEEKEIEYIWDTSGFSWKQATYVQSDVSRHIEASVETDKKVGPIEVRHKPVVIVPGIWSKRERLARLENFFKEKFWAATYAPTDPRQKAAENAAVIDKSVRMIQERENAWHVDLVAHSTGGLAARAYVDGLMPVPYDNRPTAAHLIMLGTPNAGTPCATGVENIFTKIFLRNPDSFTEISTRNMNEFNKTVRNRKGTNFSAIVGGGYRQTCQLEMSGDGVVPFMSAIYKSKNYVWADVSHENLLGDDAVATQILVWLGIPPKGNHLPDYTQSLNDNEPAGNNGAAFETNDFGKTRRYGAMFERVAVNPTTAADDPEPNFATGVKLKPNQSTEIEIPVTDGSLFSLVLYTSPDVSATLTDDKGEIVGKNLAGSAAAAGIFRTITIKKPFQAGKWKLKLESRAGEETETLLMAFINYNSTVFGGETPEAGKKI